MQIKPATYMTRGQPLGIVSFLDQILFNRALGSRKWLPHTLLKQNTKLSQTTNEIAWVKSRIAIFGFFDNMV